jgi:hypothetical protein
MPPLPASLRHILTLATATAEVPKWNTKLQRVFRFAARSDIRYARGNRSGSAA